MIDQMTMSLVQLGVTIVGFILGFGTAVWTLNRNARLQRELIDRQQRDERQAIRMAIVQELILSREMLQNDKVETAEPVRSTPRNAVYQALLPKLGALNELEIQDIIRAHDALAVFAAKVHNLCLKNAEMDGYVHFKPNKLESQLARYEGLRAECLPCVCQCIETICKIVDSEKMGAKHPQITR